MALASIVDLVGGCLVYSHHNVGNFWGGAGLVGPLVGEPAGTVAMVVLVRTGALHVNREVAPVGTRRVRATQMYNILDFLFFFK